MVQVQDEEQGTVPGFYKSDECILRGVEFQDLPALEDVSESDEESGPVPLPPYDFPYRGRRDSDSSQDPDGTGVSCDGDAECEDMVHVCMQESHDEADGDDETMLDDFTHPGALSSCSRQRSSWAKSMVIWASSPKQWRWVGWAS